MTHTSTSVDTFEPTRPPRVRSVRGAMRREWRRWLFRLGSKLLIGLSLMTCAYAQGASSALLFDGTNDYAIAYSTPEFNLQNGFTLEAWVRPTTLVTDKNLISRQTAAGQFAPWSFTIQGNRLRLWIQSSDVLSLPGLIPDQLQHVAVTWTPGTGAVVFFRNGVQFSTTTAQPSLPALAYNVVVGGLNGATSWSLAGSLDEVRVWDRVRTPPEVLATFWRRLTMVEATDASLVAYWPMDAGSGQVANDQSIHFNHLQLGSTAIADVFDPIWINGSPLAPGQPYCFGTACPCGNNDPVAGCANSSGQGCLLTGSGSNSISQSDLILHAMNAMPSASGLFFQGSDALGGGLGNAFGNGLRCVGSNVIRLQIVVPNGAGVAATSVAIPVAGGVTVGDVRRYQYWYRNPAAACIASFNLSNGFEVTWTP